MKRRIDRTVCCAHWRSRRGLRQRLASGHDGGAPPPPRPRRGDRRTPTAAAATTAASAGPIKIGFITKFPVDFYDTMVDAAKKWDADHPEVEVIFAQGKSGTDDEGEIAAIESMITQGVKAIAITPTSPNVQDALQKAVDAGIKVVLVDNDIPGWDGKSSVVATDNLAGGKLAGEFLARAVPSRATRSPSSQGVAGAPSLDDRVDGFKDGPRRRLHDRRHRCRPTATRPRGSTPPRTS